MKSLTRQNILQGSYKKSAFSGSEDGQVAEEGIVENLVSDYLSRNTSREDKFEGLRQEARYSEITEADPDSPGVSDTTNVSKRSHDDLKIDGRVLPLSRRDFRGERSLAFARSSRSIKQWEGIVEEIRDSDFIARLLDVTSGQMVPEEEGLFEISDLSRTDRKSLKVGSVFRWYVGVESLKGGQKRRISEFYFRPNKRKSMKSRQSSLQAITDTLGEIAFDE